ncbi:AMP-binding protein [Kutzneria buriramensis]|uniref:Amino acid adenylation domain-containing protein n=1 Tax=Kutzneria buriramensis TaxID=1045776 RepID=A0A3E0I742_9PSEU|nr:AMP-binding protein [Kutzneria buriramensis]REH53975.1 amino acid adenylation domain-containing protein [Kutzneria buriramensis]
MNSSLSARFLRGLDRSPDGAAIRFGDQVVTYRQAHEKALLWAGALHASGPRPPAVVGVLFGKSADSYQGLLAALYSGATVVPLNVSFPAARLRAMIDLAGVTALLADEYGLAVLDDVLCGDTMPVFDLNGDPDPANALLWPHAVTETDTAYMLFTSGSTGRPKGVPITHGNTHHYFSYLDERFDFTPDDVFSQTFDLNFDCAMFDLFCAWGAGAEICFIPPHAYRDMPAFFADHNVTVWFSTPSAIGLVRRMGGLTPGGMPTLRWSFFAGEALKCADAADWQAAAPGSTLENLYGPTELTVTITAHRWNAESADLAVNGVVPIGGLNPGHVHLLINPDGEPVEDEGELCITGPQMTPGYLDPEDDKGRFLEHGGQTWYRTGDRVRWVAPNEMAYLGRMDSQVQIHGLRVELAEIDNAVRASGVDDAVTVTRETPGGLELVVFYTGEKVPPAELNRRLCDRLPQSMVPKHYQHVDEFPLNSNRKVDRLRLAATAADLLNSRVVRAGGAQ